MSEQSRWCKITKQDIIAVCSDLPFPVGIIIEGLVLQTLEDDSILAEILAISYLVSSF